MNRTEKALARFLRASSYREKLIQRGVIQRGESLLTGGRPLAGVYQEAARRLTEPTDAMKRANALFAEMLAPTSPKATESPSAPLSDDALR
jgi:hypothetical protein